ncbi:MAG TPA: hypothetical protein VI861_01260 [Rickettsiales bacterium]|nr:hypothetical protein [Rickettsiales bacterium]
MRPSRGGTRRHHAKVQQELDILTKRLADTRKSQDSATAATAEVVYQAGTAEKKGPRVITDTYGTVDKKRDRGAVPPPPQPARHIPTLGTLAKQSSATGEVLYQAGTAAKRGPVDKKRDRGAVPPPPPARRSTAMTPIIKTTFKKAAATGTQSSTEQKTLAIDLPFLFAVADKKPRLGESLEIQAKQVLEILKIARRLMDMARENNVNIMLFTGTDQNLTEFFREIFPRDLEKLKTISLDNIAVINIEGGIIVVGNNVIEARNIKVFQDASEQNIDRIITELGQQTRRRDTLTEDDQPYLVPSAEQTQFYDYAAAEASGIYEPIPGQQPQGGIYGFVEEGEEDDGLYDTRTMEPETTTNIMPTSIMMKKSDAARLARERERQESRL